MRAGTDPFLGPLLWYAGFVSEWGLFFCWGGGGGGLGDELLVMEKEEPAKARLQVPLWWEKKKWYSQGWKSLDVSQMEAVFLVRNVRTIETWRGCYGRFNMQLARTEKVNCFLFFFLADSPLSRSNSQCFPFGNYSFRLHTKVVRNWFRAQM